MNEENIKRGDIYYADLGKGEGSEQGGVRPVLVLQNNIGNKFSPTVIVASITSSNSKTNIPTHVRLNSLMCDLPKDSIVLLEQIRTIDKKRLKDKIGKLDYNTMNYIDKSSKISLGLIDSRFDSNYITERLYKISKLDNIIEKYQNTKYDTMREEFDRMALLGDIINYCKDFSQNPRQFLENTHSSRTYEKIAI